MADANDETDDISETVRNLRVIFEGDWDEQAPMMGPPTYWEVREKWGNGNLRISVNFSPMKDKTDANFRFQGPDFSFTGELERDGFAPADTLEALVATFDQKLASPFLDHVLG